MIKAFKMNDVDGDDLLSSEEVKALLTNFNEEFTDEEIDESIKAADKDGDGQISLEEFMATFLPGQSVNFVDYNEKKLPDNNEKNLPADKDGDGQISLEEFMATFL